MGYKNLIIPRVMGPDSNESSPRSIPEEHDQSFTYEDHYLENYM